MKIFKLSIIIAIISIMSMTVHAQSENYSQNTILSWKGCYVIKTDGSLYEINMDTDNCTSKKIMEESISVTPGFVLKEDGTIRKLGSNEIIMGDVVAISSSGRHTLIVKKDCTLWGVGDNSYGQLAQGEMDNSLEQQIKENIEYKNKTKCTPEIIDIPVKIMDNVQSAIADWSKSIVLKKDGTVWTFGYDYDGSMGLGVRYVVNNNPTQILSGIKQIFASGEASFALDYNNTLWIWGNIDTGSAGGSPTSMIPIKYIENASYVTNVPGYNLVVKTDSSLWAFGESETRESFKFADDVESVAYLSDDDYLDEKVLVLKNNGDLMLLTIPIDGDFDTYTLKKIMSNVRVHREMPKKIDFSDISDKPDEMQKAVNSLSKANIIDGITNSEFAPDKPITRAEIAAMLLRMTAKNYEDGNGGFLDVTTDDWYYNTAGASKKYNIVAGFEDNTFRGDETVSAVQLVSLAARVLSNEKNLDSREDINFQTDIPDWAKGDVALAMQEELISVEKDLINPNEPMTRGEAAVILYRLYNKI